MDWGIFSFRELPWASVGFRSVHVRESGTATLSFNAEFPRNIRLLGAIGLFLASVSFRGLPVWPFKGSGAVTQSSNAEFPGNIRFLGGVGLF